MIHFDEKIKLFHLQTNETSLLIQIQPTGHLTLNFFGKKLPLRQIDYIIPDIKRASYLSDTDLIKDYKLEQLPQLFPAFGNTDLRTPAFEFEYSNGSRTTDLRYDSHQIITGKEDLAGLPSLSAGKDTETLKLKLVDSLTKVEVSILISVLVTENCFTQAVRVKNGGTDTLTINRLMSANFDLLDDQFDFIRLTGAWGRECQIKRSRIQQGNQSIESKRGASGHGENPFMALVSPETTERTGNVYAMSFVYSGNFLSNVEVDMHQNTRVQMGISPFDFTWQLASNETFTSPEVVMVFSDQGLGKMSRTFHHVFRTRLMISQFAMKERPVLINNWEATYFDFNRETLLALADEAQSIGVELFVLDDGWFGQREDDSSSLGDWQPNEGKLGGSLEQLASAIKQKNLKFGLWFEPEMVSPNSSLYQAHPEWVIQTEGRLIQQARHQYVLDLSQPAVCAYLVAAVSKILESGVVDYVKWDMNRNLTNLGSTYLAKNRQKEQAHRYILGLYSILAELTTKFPDVLFESCAGGGGRYDPGMLYYMPQTWTSDNTDAMARLDIQKGTSLVYPSISMGCHVSQSPNHQVGRETPFATRGIVAMQGNLGYEINLLECQETEKEVMAKQIRAYKKIRKIVQFGELYRLTELDVINQQAWMYLSEQQNSLLISFVQILARPNTVPKRLKLFGVDESALYQDTATGEVKSGAELTTIGLDLAKVTHDYFAQSWLLEKIN